MLIFQMKCRKISKLNDSRKGGDSGSYKEKFKMKRIIAMLFLLISQVMTAQCAMCKAVVESGDAEIVESVNSGIIYLMAFPYILIGVGVYFLYRNWKKLKL